MISNPELRKKGLELRDQLFGGQLGEQMNNAYRAISPDLETVAIEWVIGGIMARPGLDLVKRELLAVASCVHARLPDGVTAHAQGALRVGATREELFEAVFQCIPFTGLGPVIYGLIALKKAFGEEITNLWSSDLGNAANKPSDKGG
jgi:4-carboxymuconolactone decarboxylase